MPCEKEKYSSEDEAPTFEVEGLYYRKPLEVIKSAFEEEAAKQFLQVLINFSINLTAWTRMTHPNASLQSFTQAQVIL